VKAVKEVCIEDSLPYPMIPVIVLDISDREAKRLNILLNKAQGDFDMVMLSELLKDMHAEEKITEHELESMGYEEDEPSKLMHLIGETKVNLSEGNDEGLEGFAKSVTLSIEFNDVRMRDAVRKNLKEKAAIVQRKTGDYVAELLGVVMT
jgi:ParB-like chromosome segregation protein Spo0J